MHGYVCGNYYIVRAFHRRNGYTYTEMTRTVVYARLSQEEAQGKSATAEKLQARVDSSLRLAEQHGLTVLPEDIFIERESAGTIFKRPVIQHILQLASTRQITHIITNHFDRLTRGNKAEIGRAHV